MYLRQAVYCSQVFERHKVYMEKQAPTVMIDSIVNLFKLEDPGEAEEVDGRKVSVQRAWWGRKSRLYMSSHTLPNNFLR